MLKVGQKVKFLSLEELERKGTKTSSGNIFHSDLSMLSGKMMEESVGKVVTISEISRSENGMAHFLFEESIYKFNYSEWMVIPILDPHFMTKKRKDIK